MKVDSVVSGYSKNLCNLKVDISFGTDGVVHKFHELKAPIMVQVTTLTK